ncbi:hypothetical protein IAU60_005046 [Kwoniella sp. DSM 27419]
MSMLDRLRLRAASFAGSGDGSSTAPAPYRHARTPEPYETPDPAGRTWLFALPDELLERVFVRLDRVSLTRCHRVCKRLTTMLTTSAPISLHHTLQLNSLHLNPHALSPVQSNPNQIPPSKAYLLKLVSDRLKRFHRFKERNKTRIDFQESEGRLYEYLEGILLRNVPVRGQREAGREVAVYDLAKMGEWEDVEDQSPATDQEAETETADMEDGRVVEETELVNDLRRTYKFDFNMADFAVDPGQDLFVLAELRPATQANVGRTASYTLYIHLLTLSTFSPHPLAAKAVLEWPTTLGSTSSSLGFQICDDGLFILRNNAPAHQGDHLCGWQWTTGRLAVTLKPSGVSTFESFILLSPSAFVIPTVVTRLRADSLIQDNLADPRDLEFSHHLQLYAFPPFSAVTLKEGEPHPPPHAASHVATIDLPKFLVDLEHELPPPRMTIRTDPPPRHTFPTHPPEMPQPFLPDPESGLIILEFYCQPFEGIFGAQPHYVLFAHKKTLLAYLPAPTSPLLFQAFPRPAPVIAWNTVAPKVRMIGPEEPVPSWVCYVYHNRYVVPYYDERELATTIRLYDFDPLRVRQEMKRRRHDKFVPIYDSLPGMDRWRRMIFGLSTATNRYDQGAKGDDEPGKWDGTDMLAGKYPLNLVSEQSILKNRSPLAQEVRSGSDMPFIYTESLSGKEVDTVVMDGERLVLFSMEGEQEVMEVLEF